LLEYLNTGLEVDISQFTFTSALKKIFRVFLKKYFTLLTQEPRMKFNKYIIILTLFAIFSLVTPITEQEADEMLQNEENTLAAVKDFVRFHQNLLEILIEKAGLFGIVPLIGASMSSALSTFQSSTDTILLKVQAEPCLPSDPPPLNYLPRFIDFTGRIKALIPIANSITVVDEATILIGQGPFSRIIEEFQGIEVAEESLRHDLQFFFCLEEIPTNAQVYLCIGELREAVDRFFGRAINAYNGLQG